MTASAPQRPEGPAKPSASRRSAERFKLVNLDRHEYVDPERMGWGTASNQAGRMLLLDALALLISLDADPALPGVSGRWSGDRVVLVGSHSDPALYCWVTEGKNMLEVSALVRAAWVGVASSE